MLVKQLFARLWLCSRLHSASCRLNRQSASALRLALLGGVSSCCCCFWGCLLVMVLVLVLLLLLLLLLAAPASLEAAKILSHVFRFGKAENIACCFQCATKRDQLTQQRSADWKSCARRRRGQQQRRRQRHHSGPCSRAAEQRPEQSPN